MNLYAVKVEYRDYLGRIVEDFDSVFLSRDAAHTRKTEINSDPGDHGMVAWVFRYAVRKDKPWTRAPTGTQYNSEVSRGERNHSAKLTEDQVREARVRHAAGESPSALAKEYGMTKGGMYQVLSRKTWKHV